jgi:hypothetical protein
MCIQIDYDYESHRIRCIAHIINLSLQALLLASSQEALIAALQAAAQVSGEEFIAQFSEVLTSEQRYMAANPLTVEEVIQNIHSQRRKKCRNSTASQESLPEEFTGTQNMPTLRKLHKLAVWLRNSSIHMDEWRDTVGIELGIDNQTRWSSWYQVIERAIRKKLEINNFMADHEGVLGDMRFTTLDWDLLGKARKFLEPFASSTLYAEGRCASISQSLLIMDALLKHYEQAKVSLGQK